MSASNPIMSGLSLGAMPGADHIYRDNPFGLLDMLRENQPLLSLPDGLYGVSRYADVSRLLRETKGGMRDSRDQPVIMPPAAPDAPIDPNDFMLFRDGAPHTRLRKLVSKAFTPRMVDSLRPEMEAVADACIDRAIERGDFDVARDLARVVPSTIICMMLGVPIEDREMFTDWTTDLTHALDMQFNPENAVARAGPAFENVFAYFEKLIEKRRKSPTQDLLSELVQVEEAGDRLSPSELMTQCVGLLAAGFETTIGLIGLGTRQLLQHPDELAKLRARPELIGSAIEECLRFDPPIIATMRVVHEEVEFHGTLIPKDSRVIALIAAANRDPRAYTEPERFDITREGPPHWSFGGGEHFCLGAHLARLEAQIAIGTMVRRLDALEIGPGGIEWTESVFRVPGKLPVTFVPA